MPPLHQVAQVDLALADLDQQHRLRRRDVVDADRLQLQPDDVQMAALQAVQHGGEVAVALHEAEARSVIVNFLVTLMRSRTLSFLLSRKDYPFWERMIPPLWHIGVWQRGICPLPVCHRRGEGRHPPRRQSIERETANVRSTPCFGRASEYPTARSGSADRIHNRRTSDGENGVVALERPSRLSPREERLRQLTENPEHRPRGRGPTVRTWDAGPLPRRRPTGRPHRALRRPPPGQARRRARTVRPPCCAAVESARPGCAALRRAEQRPADERHGPGDQGQRSRRCWWSGSTPPSAARLPRESAQVSAVGSGTATSWSNCRSHPQRPRARPAGRRGGRPPRCWVSARVEPLLADETVTGHHGQPLSTGSMSSGAARSS